MVTVNDILNYMETITPQHMQYDWDNTGLLCGRRTKAVNKIMVALDPFEEVCLKTVCETANEWLNNFDLTGIE